MPAGPPGFGRRHSWLLTGRRSQGRSRLRRSSLSPVSLLPVPSRRPNRAVQRRIGRTTCSSKGYSAPLVAPGRTAAACMSRLRTVAPGTSICQVGSTLSSSRSAAPRPRAGLPRSTRRALWTADGASPCRREPTGCQASRPKSNGGESCPFGGRTVVVRAAKTVVGVPCLSDRMKTAQICRREPSRFRSCSPTGDQPVSRPPSHQ